ncbi:hypothetical protein DMENIID0001_170850 [Sergentomyia squamirostris]
MSSKPIKRTKRRFTIQQTSDITDYETQTSIKNIPSQKPEILFSALQDEVDEILPDCQYPVDGKDSPPLLTDLCRLCLSASRDQLEIFGEQGSEEDLANIIALLFNCYIVQGDSWPQNICVVCFEKVKEYHGFFSTVKNTEVNLEKLLGNPVDDKVPIVKMEPQIEIKTDITGEKLESPNATVPEMDFDTYCSLFEKPKRKRSRIRKKGGTSKKAVNDSLIRKYASLICEFCLLPLGSYDELQEHCAVVHNARGYVSCCNHVYKERRRLVEHVQLHENPCLFQCKTCGKKCKSKPSLETHEFTHMPSDQRTFKCDECSKSFLRPGLLKEHQKVHSAPGGVLSYNCDQCSKNYSSKISLYCHKQLVHERKQTTVCEICAKVFVTRDGFEAHKIKHMDKKPPRLECALCGTKIRDRKGMVTHMRKQHRPPKAPATCNQCGKITRSKGALHYHMKTIHSNILYPCHLCDKTFKRALNLKEHMASHTGIKLYSCNFCEKTVNSNANKYSHQKKMHPIEWREAIRRKEEEADAQ